MNNFIEISTQKRPLRRFRVTKRGREFHHFFIFFHEVIKLHYNYHIISSIIIIKIHHHQVNNYGSIRFVTRRLRSLATGVVRRPLVTINLTRTGDKTCCWLLFYMQLYEWQLASVCVKFQFW